MAIHAVKKLHAGILAVFIAVVVVVGIRQVGFSRAAILSSDINADGIVNIFDLSVLLTKWNSADPAADVNKDGIVDVFDLSQLLTNWGKASVPDPTPTATATASASPTPSPVPPGSCDPTRPAPTNNDPGTVVLADNFESHDLSKWTSVTQGGDATAAVQSAIFNSPGCAAEINVTANLLSKANLIKDLPAATQEVWASGWFDITREGVSAASNAPTMRFFNGTTRILDVSRQNVSGDLFVRWPTATSFSYNSLQTFITLNKGYNIKIHLKTNKSSSVVEIWLDGVKIFDRSKTGAFVDLGTNANVTRLMVGADHDVQDSNVVADDVVLKTVGP